MAGKVEKLADHRQARKSKVPGAPDGRTGAGRTSAAGRCPLCGNPMVARHRPFCSKRCADIDLGNWLGGHYRIAAEPLENTQKNDESGET
jgi:endogenous inhibitor of DNA gyrase (YacG/DUF329 family)